jgi:putative ABC transport system permease protein
MRITLIAETIWQDIRNGVRVLQKSTGFALAVVLTLGLGIGLNAAIFSMVSGILLREPPVKNPERIAIATLRNLDDGSERNPASALEFSAWRQQGHFFEEVAAAAYDDVTMTGGREPERVTTARVTPNYFDLLGVSARVGRTFVPATDEGILQTEAVVSYDLWRNRFGGDPRIIGKGIVLAGKTYTVIGVMPEDFNYVFAPCKVWIPASFVAESAHPDERDIRNLNVFVRLKNGVSLRQAEIEASLIVQRLAQNNPADKNWVPALIELRKMLVEPNTRTAILCLMGVVGVVLMIACANVTGLFLSHSASRQNEFAVRVALGASRTRLVQQVLLEGLLLALSGCGLGLLACLWCVKLLRARLTFAMQAPWLAARIEVNRDVLLFALAVACFTVLLFALLPALRSSRPDLHTALKEGARTASPSGSRNRMRSTIVIGQVALAVVLMASTETLVQLVIKELHTPLGFDPRHVLVVNVSLDAPNYTDPTKQSAFFSNAIERIQSLPGVYAVGLTQELPESYPSRIGFEIEGQPSASRSEERPLAGAYFVSSDYFEAMKVPLLKGRSFSLSDRSNAANVIIVNETFAKRCRPNEDVIGKFVRTYATSNSVPISHQIVGVVGDVIDRVGQNDKVPQIYTPFPQNPLNAMIIAIRASGNPMALAPTVRQSIWAIDKDQPIGTIETLTGVIERKGASDRLLGGLLGSFTVLALGLAAMGIYGVVSYLATQRTREVGLRMALGAHQGSVFVLVVGKGVLLAAIGTALGFLLALPILRIVVNAQADSWLWSLFILVMGCIFVVGLGLLAGFVPARRATRVDPMVALRHE